MIKPLWFNPLVLVTLLVTACGSVTSASVADPTAMALVSPAGVPTLPPPPTGVPTLAPLPGTSTPVTPPSAYTTQEAARQATIVARATASPFPTAGLAIVQTGQPASATTQRDGLSFHVRLPKDTYLAGEGGQAEITLRNDGPETVFVLGGCKHFWLALLDEQGYEPLPWPWAPMRWPGWDHCMGNKLAPGQVLTGTLPFQVPPTLKGTGAEQATDHSYVLWAETHFSRPAPDNPEWTDNLRLHLETGPIPLQVIQPEPEQRLVADLQADREGWHLRVTDANGHVPPGPLWGFQEIASSNAASAGPLRHSPDAIWSAAWHEHEWDDESEVCLRAWVAAPGYVTAAVTETVPGAGEARCMLGAGESPLGQTFTTLEAVQAATEFPLYRPGSLPGGAALDGVRIKTVTFDGGSQADIHQSYHLADDLWLELTQRARTEPWAGFGWGQARSAPEARPVAVGQTTGYVVQQFGWWTLDWRVGDVGFELRATVTALSLEELLTIATGVQPPEDDVSE